ncbi:hypothetical protein [Rhodococcoides fascians]|uniref:hypothetical protein n=1 Tax=Rhodococcoides fascians TaxID=1828 RepID=UPI001E030135|nr:hypothetical protein [Rhodococcus fascians]CAH0189624.1 hypothetical protein SRABI91_01638 [Rhodococcus fascians]
MRTIGYQQIRTSDLTGAVIPNEEVVNVVVRHPNPEEARQFDATQEELKALKVVGNLVTLEYRFVDGTSKEVYSNATEFAKLVPDDKLVQFDQLRGRRKGYRPATD